MNATRSLSLDSAKARVVESLIKIYGKGLLKVWPVLMVCLCELGKRGRGVGRRNSVFHLWHKRLKGAGKTVGGHMNCETSNIPGFSQAFVVVEEMSFKGDDSPARPTVEYLEERSISTCGLFLRLRKTKE